MDDFSVSSLSESKNEWCARLLNIMTPSVMQGLKSIFDEAVKLCHDNKENDKYLMTFQNFLTRVPKWNPAIIDAEKTRICATSGCTYLEELVTCVHIVQLKALTCVRVGTKQKKVDINVPSISDFVHKIYIHVARKIYTNIYLYEKNIAPLQVQKNNREIETIVKECVLNAIRDSIPVEHILRAYMDETEEQDVEVKEVEEPLPDKVEPAPPVKTDVAAVPAAAAVAVETPSSTVPVPGAVPGAVAAIAPLDMAEYKKTSIADGLAKLSFSENDTLVDTLGVKTTIVAPKDDENLEALEKARSLTQKLDEDDDDDDDDGESDRLMIGDNIKLDITDINDLGNAALSLKAPVLDFEVLI
jgi:hypothetical protein